MHADRLHRATEFAERALIEVDIGCEPLGIAADDRQHQRQVVARRADHRFRASAHADPGLQRAGLRLREDTLIDQRRAQTTPPGDRRFADQGGEQIQLLLEQLVVLRQLEAEQWERLGERTPAQDHLGSAVRGRVHGREALEDADGIVGTEDRHGRTQLDPLRPAGDRRQHHLGR